MLPWLAQLIELLPHFARLVPALERFLQSKGGNDEASRRALAEVAEGLRGDLTLTAEKLHHDIALVTSSHAGLYRQLNEQSEKMAELGAAMRSIEATFDTMERRTRRIEKRLGSLIFLGFVWVVLLVGVIVVELLHK